MISNQQLLFDNMPSLSKNMFDKILKSKINKILKFISIPIVGQLIFMVFLTYHNFEFVFYHFVTYEFNNHNLKESVIKISVVFWLYSLAMKVQQN